MQTNKPISSFYSNIREIILESRKAAYKTVNFIVVIQNWEIGRNNVEEEQSGKFKAEYGKYLIKDLAQKLSSEFGKGYSQQHLKFCRQFYNLYPIGYALRSQSQSSDNVNIEKGYALRSQNEIPISEQILSRSHPLFQIINTQLSWIHYQLFN